MPFCTQCAQPIPDAARFCGACGAPVASAPAATSRAGGAIPAGAATARASAATPAPPDISSLTQQATIATPASIPGATPTSSSGAHGRFDPGTRIGTRYRIVALLGRGGMGEVFRADDLELGQSVALKFLPPGVASDPAELARFRGEVRLARMIAHPNVCRVYDIGDVGGNVFLSMEYIDGEDLASVLRRMGRPTPDKALEIARQVCLGLAAAHDAGMLHRDLKPANVMIDGRGRARITDFGLAGLADELAKGGTVAGTPAYMAPEQIAGGRVTVKSDVYALGLVLYELFTGKRAFDAGSLAELRQLQESGSITSPSSLARDLDPAVERVILRCVERDPDTRPASAYAVLGALPGGDPLAAAIAAGETPSPELVANAGDRGGMAPGVAAACVAVGLAGIAAWAGLIGPEFRAMTQPTPVLAVRAADVLSHTAAFGALPAHTAEGFALNQTYLTHLRTDRAERAAKHSAAFYWRRWSPRALRSPSIHAELEIVNQPEVMGVGEATVLFDPAGRLIGLRAVPADSTPAAPGGPAWSVLWSAAGLDSTTFARAPLPRPAPAVCDSSVAWTGPLPWAGGEKIAVQMGASRGRLVEFTMVHDWGTTTAPVDSLAAESSGAFDWIDLLLFTLLPLGASVYFGTRNLRLGRGDWRNATRIAVFVGIMNLLEGLFTKRLSEVGLANVLFDLFAGRALGHALLHGVEMWFAYVALEPYLRRLWPRMLVSWTRLVSGRIHDPLVGRDVLIGVAAGLLLNGLGVAVAFAGERLGITRVPTLLGDDMLRSLTSLSNTACLFAYSASICILSVLETLVVLLMLRLLLRRTSAAVGVTLLLLVVLQAQGNSTTNGWPIATVEAVISSALILVLMRFGLLAAVATTFVGLVSGYAVASLDLSAWYGVRAMVAMAVLVGLLGYGAITALAGKPILGDPLREPAAR